MPARGRRGAAHDVARPGRDGARLHARGPHPVRHDARAAVLPQLSRIHARPRGRACRSCCRSARSITSRTVPARRWSSAATRRIPRAGSATGAAPPATCGSMPRAAATSAACREIAGNITSPMWIGDRVYFLSRRRGRRQPVLDPSRRRRHAAPHGSRRLLRAPRADRRQARRLPVRRATSGCTTSRARQRRARSTSTCPRIARRPRASSSARGEYLGELQRASGRSQRRARRARQALHDGLVGRRGASVGHARRRASSSWRSGWPTARRSSRSATRRARSACRPWNGDDDPLAAVGRRARDRDARRARAARSSPSPTIATR